MPNEKRRAARVRFGGSTAQVHYVDVLGQNRFERVQVEDLGPQGCRVLLRFRCEPRTLISFSMPPKVRGNATVRYQNQNSMGYATGLEFLGGLVLQELTPEQA